MRSIINNGVCTDMVNCRQSGINTDSQYLSDEGVFLNQIYVANTTLVKLNAGSLTITSSHDEVLECTAESLILIEKNQILNINCHDVDNHLDFRLIDLSYDLVSKMYSHFFVSNKMENMVNIHRNIGSHMLCAPLRAGMSEAFDNLYNCLQKVESCECGDCTLCQAEDEVSQLDFTLMFLLSPFTSQGEVLGILARAVKSSLREKIFNMIKNDPSKVWCLDDVAANLYMSRSTLKRKLAMEGTSFSEIYLDVRMRMAARLLRAGEYNINQVSVMCGYSRSSYFITTFKRHYQMTPYTFMKLANH